MSQSFINNEECDFDKHTLDTFNITSEHCKLLKLWIGYTPKFKLLYRASRDGYTKE